MDQRNHTSGGLAYDVVEIAPFTYVLYKKGTTEKVNLMDKFAELEAQGHFSSTK